MKEKPSIKEGKIKKINYLVLILFLFFCCGPKQEKIEKYMEDGVEVIVNHLEPYKIKGEPSNLSLEEDFIIDFERDDLADVGIADIAGFDVDSEGNTYIWSYESSENFIFKFDSNGNFAGSFGRKGQGPGEIVTSYYLRINEQDEILISDGTRKKLWE